MHTFVCIYSLVKCNCFPNILLHSYIDIYPCIQTFTHINTYTTKIIHAYIGIYILGWVEKFID